MGGRAPPNQHSAAVSQLQPRGITSRLVSGAGGTWLELKSATGRVLQQGTWKGDRILAAGAAFILGSSIMANIIGIPESADMSGYNYLRGNLPMPVFALVGVFIVSSLGEEIIYRGFLINRLAELGSGGKAGIAWAVVASAVGFGLVHCEWGLMGIVQTGFMGMALGVSYLLVRRNLWVRVLAHAYMDTALLVQQYLAVE